MKKNSFKLSSLMAAVMFLFSITLFVGCGGSSDAALKKQIEEKDAEIASLNAQLEAYTNQKSSYTSPSGATINVVGGTLEVKEITESYEKVPYLYIHSMKNKPGFAVWERETGGQKTIVSAENTYQVGAVSDIRTDATFTAKYTAIGFMIVSGNFASGVSSVGEFTGTSIFSAKYSFTPGNPITNNNFSVTGGTGISYAMDEVDYDELLECYKLTTTENAVSFVRIFLPDNVDPYKVIEPQPAEPQPSEGGTSVSSVDEPLLDDAGNQIRTYTNNDALCFVMRGVNLANTDSNKSVCFSCTNRKSENAEVKKLSVIVGA